jgi:glutathione S-transferase
MMKLRSSTPSPFGRKVKIAADLLGLSSRIDVIHADTTDPGDELRRQNPLGKIPTLILEDGTTLYDSRVIVEYLDHLAGGGKIIPTGPTRFQVLTLQALGDGIMDAGILRVYEVRWRDEERREQKWVDHQIGKMTRALAALEAAPPAIHPLPDIGAIAVACALGYMDLRFEGTWRHDFPRLVHWLDEFSGRVPAFEKTRFRG